VSLNLGGPNRACSAANNVPQRRLTSLFDPNRVLGGSKIGTTETWDDRGTRDYHGMLLSVNKRMSRNFSVSGNYTWSHCIGHPVNNFLQGTTGAGVFNHPDNIDRDRGNCGNEDIRHNMNATGIIRMPQFSDTWTQRLFGDWRLSGIFRARSGGHLTPTVSADRALTQVNVGSQRANLLSSDVYGNQCTSDLRSSNPSCRWLNSASFGTPALGTLGNAGPGILVGPGNWSLDAGLTRTFRVTEAQQLEFRAEADNVLNHTNFNNPNVSVGNANFGRITGAGDPRIIQFAVKYIF
jgi:hypothetical protein